MMTSGGRFKSICSFRLGERGPLCEMIPENRNQKNQLKFPKSFFTFKHLRRLDLNNESKNMYNLTHAHKCDLLMRYWNKDRCETDKRFMKSWKSFRRTLTLRVFDMPRSIFVSRRGQFYSHIIHDRFQYLVYASFHGREEITGRSVIVFRFSPVPFRNHHKTRGAQHIFLQKDTWEFDTFWPIHYLGFFFLMIIRFKISGKFITISRNYWAVISLLYGPGIGIT